MNGSENKFDIIHERLTELDLSWIHKELLNPEGDYKWSDDKVRAIDRAYRRFLATCTMFPEESIVPSNDVDVFWHLHILNTLAYTRDTQKVLGFYLHHVPSSDGEKSILKEAFLKSQQMEVQLFPTEVIHDSQPADCNGASCSRCSDGKLSSEQHELRIS